MKHTIKLSGLLLLASSGVFAQANTSYFANTTPITGSYNTAFGVGVLFDNTSGHRNTATGFQALTFNTNGTDNTAAGYKSLYGNITGAWNTAIGYQALLYNTGGHGNSAIGYNSLSNNETGVYNSAVGYGALMSNVLGSRNVGIGHYANVGSGNLSYATAIGSGAISNTHYKIRLGNTFTTTIEGQVPYSNPSDGRFKNNISETDVKGLDFIKLLRPVVYNFDTRKFQEFLTQNMPDSIRQEYLKADFTSSTAIRQSGFIAQEVEVAAKQCGYNFNGVHTPDTENDNYSIAYSQFVVPLVKGMQEQQAMIETQQKEIEELKKIVNELVSNSSNTGSTIPMNDVSVYPNPTKGAFTISTTNVEQGTISIVDMEGRMIQTIQLQKGVSAYPIDLTTQGKGVYLVTIQTNNGQVSKRIVVE